MNDSIGGPAEMAGSVEPLDWQFSQVFGERSPGEEVQEGKNAILGQLSLLAVAPVGCASRGWASLLHCIVFIWY